MAYAALLSLSQTLDQILARQQHTRELERGKLVSLQEYVGELQTFVEEYSRNCRGAENPFESRIITVAQHAEDIIEFRYSFHHFFSKFCLADIFQICLLRCWSPLELNSASLRKVLKTMGLILEDAMKIKISNPTEKVSSLGSPSLSTDASSDVNTKIMEDNFRVIKDQIYDKYRNFQVIPIVGMGGIGKSTLARRLYEDSRKTGYFDKYLWVVVSQDYTPEKLFTQILLSMGKPATGDLKQQIYQEFYSRRYLVVVDDLWSKEPWDKLNLILPRDTAGSRVLVTTRLSEVASYVGSSSSPPHEMQLLNEFQSWTLFEEGIFGKGSSCLPELEQIGKNVVKSCRGLPLTIVVISGILKGDTTKEYWESISEKLCLPQPTIVQHCSEILSLSYNHLPLYLKPCFLYATAFPEDYEVNANRLIRLWMAEGFVKPSGSKIMEEVAEGYLHDLVGRSLLIVSEKARYSDRIKTIRIHDLLRDFGISTAEQERFYFQTHARREHRRVTNPNLYYSLPPLLKFSKPATRSVLIFNTMGDSYSFGNLRLLRVLDASDAYMEGDMSELVHLRYLSIQSREGSFVSSSQQLPNIQTLIIGILTFNELTFILPLRIWKTPSLRHLILSPECRLEEPSDQDEIYEESSLHTLTVSNLRLSKKMCDMLLNLRKLKVSYSIEKKADDSWDRERVKRGRVKKGRVKRERVKSSSDDDNDYGLINLVLLQKLEKLTISTSFSSPRFFDLAFPESLKKLSLFNINGYWKDLSAVGSLPNLEVLELKCFASNWQEVWEPIEGQFLKLKLLKFEREWLALWEAESVHFQSLEVLVLRDITNLKEIPSGIGEINTLRVIELVDCNESVVDSAKRIQADQWEMGNQGLQLLVAASDNSQGILYKEIRPEGY